MSYTKKKKEIEYIIEAGRLMGEILAKLEKMIAPGVSSLAIDAEAERLIRGCGAVPAFKGYKTHKSDIPFPGTLCFSLNEEVVHGIPSLKKIIKAGDLVSLDIGMQYPAACGMGLNGDGFFVDTALTVYAGKKVPTKEQKLLDVTRVALEKGLQQCVVGNTVADIGRAIEEYVKSQGEYGIVRDLVGHGVGHAVHEEPHVPNYYSEELEDWILKENVVLALEPMINEGTFQVKVAADGWSIQTKDGKKSAHFEHTVVITKNGPLVVTRRPHEKI
jgi:methionyl aminopeptidase